MLNGAVFAMPELGSVIRTSMLTSFVWRTYDLAVLKPYLIPYGFLQKNSGE